MACKAIHIIDFRGVESTCTCTCIYIYIHVYTCTCMQVCVVYIHVVKDVASLQGGGSCNCVCIVL